MMSPIPKPSPELFPIKSHIGDGMGLTHCLMDRQIVESVRVVVCRGTEVLVGQRRSADSQRGYLKDVWELPGGKLEGQPIEDAAEREVAEETGVAINSIERLGVVALHTVPNTSREGRYAGALIVQHAVRAFCETTQLTTSNEHRTVQWQPAAVVWQNAAFRPGTDTALLRAGVLSIS